MGRKALHGTPRPNQKRKTSGIAKYYRGDLTEYAHSVYYKRAEKFKFTTYQSSLSRIEVGNIHVNMKTYTPTHNHYNTTIHYQNNIFRSSKSTLLPGPKERHTEVSINETGLVDAISGNDQVIWYTIWIIFIIGSF